MHNVYVYKISKTYFSNSIQNTFSTSLCIQWLSMPWITQFTFMDTQVLYELWQKQFVHRDSTNCEVMHVFLRDSLYVVFVHLFNNKLTCAGFPGYECKDSTCPRELRTCGTKTRSICQKFQWSVLLSRFRGELCDQDNVETKSRYTHSNLNDSEDK